MTLGRDRNVSTLDGLRGSFANVKFTNRAIVLASFAIAAFLIFFPLQRLVSYRASIAELEVKLEAFETSNQQLERNAKLLSDPANAALLARERLGVIKPGERSYYFVEPPVEELPPPPRAVQPKGWWSRTWDRVFN